ncbi:transcriptional antiterminator [candidate division WOR-3 bacterium JGI_Cruoil_03_44_89]|uniref:Transcriptional antiterminator n=1 Tax=candidate division WOR-3 bacterium JGI_Cruoil_03_44_89 TaxID=1973748 RepID=A0A235BXV5_UNCW3|nr:MAG: transcriptional antiterminator [candidate division WOR-3 bacterium JGI_Cruoil_03_44_89]
MRRLFLSVVISFGIFSGCTKKEPLLTFAVGGAPNEVDYWEELIREFENRTHISVKLLRQPTDTDLRRQSLVTPLNAKEKDPDLFLMDVAWVAQFAASGWLFSLDSRIKKTSFDITQLFSSVVNQVDVYKGEVISLPVYIDCGLLYFRKDLLIKYGCPVPEIWSDFLECAKEIQGEERKNNPNFYGFVWQGAQYEGLVCNFIEFIASNGGDITDKSGSITVNSEENIQALQFMRDLIHKYKISPPNTFTEMREEEVRTFFESGNALFERNWPYAWKLHDSQGSPVRGKVGITLLPKFDNGRHAASLGGWHIGISRYSDKKDEAWELVKFILSYKTQKKLCLNLAWNPARVDVYDDTEVKERMPHMNVLKKAFENAVARPNFPYYTQISEVLQRYVNTAISGKINSGEALEQAQQEIFKNVKRYHE